MGSRMEFVEIIGILFMVCLLAEQGTATESLQEPRFVTQPSGVSNILIESRTKILQCQARGYPQPKYRWFKDGVALSNELTSEPFWRIQSPKRKDAGVYYCVATNDVGSVFSERVKFSVAYMGIFEDPLEKLVDVEFGGAAILELPEIESHPPPDVTWSTPDGPIPYDIKYAVSENKLLILNANDRDEGSYRARALNTYIGKEEYSPFFKLKVDGDSTLEVPPTIIIQPRDTKIIKDQSVSNLDCIANARSLHELRTLWTKDGIPIENARISFSFRDLWNRTLELISANSTYRGVYTCHVEMRSGGFPVINSSASVDVLEKPTFVSELKRETHGEYGSQVRIPCDVLGVPTPKIEWFHNAQPVGGTRFHVDDDGSLVIKRLTMDYAGMFQCLASNEAGEASSYTWLKVKTSTPILETSPRNLTVLDGKDATLTCRAVGAPIPNTTWIFNDTIPVEIAGRVQLLESGDLSISPVKVNDAGKYTCIRSNDAGTVNGSGYLSIHVRTQIIRPPSDTSVLLGHTAELQCRVSNDPNVPFDIDWFHNSQLMNLRASPRVKMRDDGALEIVAVRASDVGEYTCSVISPGGNETRSARLSVIELPFAPINVIAERNERISPRAINVTWVPGFDGNSPTTKFVVERRVVPEMGPIADTLSNWVVEDDNVSAVVRWCLLRDLKAAAAYQFRVTAVNLVGEGPPSEPSNIVALPQEPPSGPPVGLVGSARSDSEIITQWQPPLEEHRNGHILGYILRYRLHGYYNQSPWITHNITNEAQKNYLISDLITWKDYIVQIAAYNDKGVGVFTEGLIIKTKEGRPEAPPTNVRAEAVNSTSIGVWWKPPNPQKINGINQGYKIQAWTGGNFTDSNEFKSLKVPPSLFDPLAEQSAVISGLRKYTIYNITVLCFTDPGDGERSTPIEVRTSEDVPGEVENLQFDDISDRALTVRWSPPGEVNGVLTGYKLTYQIKDNVDSLRVLNFSADVLSSKVEHLQPTTHYRFEVTAWTSRGAGRPRVATIQSGVEPVLPEPPLKLALSNIDAFSVVLQFTPGFDGNSSILTWSVQAQTPRNTTWYTIFEVSDPDASTITVGGLIPFMQYKLRLIAVNVVGASKPSEPTKEFQTIQAPPSHPPRNVTVRAMSATELRVRWIPLQQIEWYGNPRGYNVTFTEVRTNKSKSIAIEDHTANSYVLEAMEEFALYEIVMQAYNDVGSSPSSPKAIERTRESVPSVGPSNVEANATSSTTILVRWGEIPVVHQNGQIEGYKVFYGASGSPYQYKNIPRNTTFTTTLTELRKFVQYHIQVLGYTRLGDGALSGPPVRVQTFEDVPGPPSNVSFPDVSFSTARIIWDTPEDPNGEILAYKVMFHLNNSQERIFSKEFPASDRTFQAHDLEAERYYMFSVAAQTRLGWGKTASGLVLTTNNRERPQPPSMPQVSRSQVQSRQITFSWTPGPDGFAPLRYYTVQKSENSGPFQIIPERVDPTLTSYTANNLKPFTYYQFRIQGTNDIGPSSWSGESIQVQTLPAAPARGVTGLRVVPITTTSVEVHWEVIEEVHWSGDYETGGYRVVYQPVSDFPTALEATPKQEILGIRQGKMVLSDLMEDRNYEIVVLPFNSEGDGPASPPVTVYVGEAVPTGEPQGVRALPISGTEVTLQWRPPLANMQNGDLLGYKIFYLVTDSPQALEKKQEEEIEVVPASYLIHNLVFLDKYTEYRIEVLAFNPAGDGPRSPPITVRTKQDLPGAPMNLQFSEITMTSMRVTWDPPRMRNGEIVGYIVTYETAEQNDKFSKQVKQKVTEGSLLVQPLEEEVTYTFMVRALTIDFGPPVSGNVTTGPQEGSPMAPSKLSVTKTPVSSVDMQWVNGASGKGPILGYYIETRRKDETRWQTIVKTSNGPLTDYSVSYQNLLPSTSYLFRVISYNRYGISYPAYSSETVVTPSKLYFEYAYLQYKPFYRQTWFMVTLAATSIVIIIMVVAVLCVKSKSYKYKQEAQKTLEESMAMDIDDRQASDLSLYRTRPSGGTLNIGSACGTLGKRSTLGRKSIHPPPPPMHGKSPPRPSPASVAYHSDEESLKGYDENPDDSSVTEKPSEISSTDSQGSESENESVQSDPHSFVNHYANVNDSLRQSWKRQKPVRNYSSYTDSEPEGSAVVSLNGGQIIMNNMARSRAPLPGFSSFV
ncbi:protein sidekick isoform X2 [Fopius arisanus]|uniref:Protein sidekick isoform X2 n=1 Tax=Fopius arisanus TaxID=64838 RepID=A0A9R1TH79_9HYME|nr:PREDICTED: protein sidekick isoform X2 [Fopius arisanus]